MTETMQRTFTDPEAALMAEEVDRLTALNKTGFDELGKIGIVFDGLILAFGQIECLYATLAEVMGPQGERFEQLARLRWEQRLNQEIEDARSKGLQHQLRVGGSFTPGMIRQLASATGTFGGTPGFGGAVPIRR